MKENKWLRLLTYVTGLVNQELLLQNEYLAAENKILRAHLPARLRLSDPERSTLAEIGKRLGRKVLAQVACVAKPATILAWYRRLIGQKFDGSKCRSYPGRPRIEPKLEALIVQMARENSGWGYDRIVGALSNLGYRVSDETVGNVLRRHCIRARAQPEPKYDLEGVHSIPHGGLGWDRLLHSRGTQLARPGDLLRIVLHPLGEPTCEPGWDHAASRRSLDAADGA
jgi:homeodomain-containing protein